MLPLKRFNVILDYKNWAIYAKTNNLANSSYSKPRNNNTSVMLIAGAVVLFIASGVYFVMKRKKKKQ